jgi:rod shape-determining protein MreC
MRKLIAFLQRFRVFLIFMILQLTALSFYFSFVSYPRTKFLNSANKVSGTFHSVNHSITQYLSLKEANLQLQAENSELASQIPSSFINIDSKTTIINDTIHQIAFERIPATVIHSTFSHSNNYFTINAGTKRGIQKGMGVVSPKGVVGIVYDVSQHYAVVKSILTSDINISAQLEYSKGYGLIKYNDNGPLRVNLTGISNDIGVSRGEKVRTMGSAGYFPPGLLIGVVEDRVEIEGKPMWELTIRLGQDMRQLHHVYVLKNIFQLELKELEKDIPELNEEG